MEERFSEYMEMRISWERLLAFKNHIGLVRCSEKLKMKLWERFSEVKIKDRSGKGPRILRVRVFGRLATWACCHPWRWKRLRYRSLRTRCNIHQGPAWNLVVTLYVMFFVNKIFFIYKLYIFKKQFFYPSIIKIFPYIFFYV